MVTPSGLEPEFFSISADTLLAEHRVELTCTSSSRACDSSLFSRSLYQFSLVCVWMFFLVAVPSRCTSVFFVSLFCRVVGSVRRGGVFIHLPLPFRSGSVLCFVYSPLRFGELDCPESAGSLERFAVEPPQSHWFTLVWSVMGMELWVCMCARVFISRAVYAMGSDVYYHHLFFVRSSNM